MSGDTSSRSTTDKVVFFLLIGVSFVASVMIFGWTERVAAATGCTTIVLWMIYSAIKIFQAAREEQPDAKTRPQIDWLALGKAQVHVEGKPSRYLARFTGWLPPAVEETGPGRMSSEERNVARALRRLGMPYAAVSKMEDRATAEMQEMEGTTIVVIPGSMV